MLILGEFEAALDAFEAVLRITKPGNWLYRDVQKRIVEVYRDSGRLAEYVEEQSRKRRRPNYEQALELAFLIADTLKAARG